MGQLIGDRRAEQVSFPASTEGEHGDLYRINGFTGFLINDVGPTDTSRLRALETAVNRSWWIKMPAALNPAVGAHLDWSAGAGFKRGDTDLVAAGAGAVGVVKVIYAKNAQGYAGVVIVSQKPTA